MTATPGPQLWFLTGSQGLYGPETLDQVANQSKEIAGALDAGPELTVPVVWKPVLTDADAIRRIMLEANNDDACIGVIAWMHTFSPAKMWITGLDQLRKPLLHLHTQANRDLPWASIDMDFMNLNQAAHGDREFGFIQTRLGVARKTVAGHVSSPRVRERIATWQRAALGAQAIRALRVARFGDNMRNVAVTEGDKVEAEHRFGMSVNTYAVNDLVTRVDAADAGAVDSLVEEYLDVYDVAPELRPGGNRHDSLRYGARIELGLREFLEDGGFWAFTSNFSEDLGGLRQLPGLAVQRLMGDGYGFGGEGDWKTSVLVRTAKAMATGRPGGTSFMEDYTYDFGASDPLIHWARTCWRVCPTIGVGKAASGDPSTLHRRPEGPGAAGLRRGARRRGGGRPGRHGRAVPDGTQRDRHRRAAPRPAGAAGGAGGLEAAAQPRDVHRMLADRRRTAPYRAVDCGRCRGVQRLGRHPRRRARENHRRDDLVAIPRRAPLEPGLLPPRAGALDLPLDGATDHDSCGTVRPAAVGIHTRMVDGPRLAH